MAPEAANAAQIPTRQLSLPVLIFGMPEIRRLHRELEALEEFMHDAAVRMPGTQPGLPRLSRLCEALASENKLNLLLPADLKLLQTFIVTIEQTAPQVHISFAADPSSAFTGKVVTWLRNSIHPWTLLQVGLQPTIAAGCTLRTNNRVFDFSLRERFTKTQAQLIESFEAEAASVVAAPLAPAAGQAAPAPAASAPASVPTGQAVPGAVAVQAAPTPAGVPA